MALTSTAAEAAASSAAPQGGRSATNSEPPDLKVPELMLTGVDLQKRNVHLQLLYKKGKRFESQWKPYYVGVYAQLLYYYERLDDMPHGIVPLLGSTVKAVDRIFKNTGESDEPYSEACGPCWKLTSRIGRVFLFRSPTVEFRDTWIDLINEGNPEHTLHRNLARMKTAEQPRSTEKRQVEVVPDMSETLRDAMILVKKQKQEIQDLKHQLDAERARSRKAEAAAAAAATSEATLSSSAMSRPASAPKRHDAHERNQLNSDFVVPVMKTQRRGSFDITDNSYLQQQAMELAEIARNLQSSFQIDSNSIDNGKTSSSAPAAMGAAQDQSTSRSSISKSSRVVDEIDVDRLSDLDELDDEFAEPSGLLDSIHKVMKDFIQSAQTPKQSKPMIISDEIIAQINEEMGAETNDYEADLRGNRSRSSCDVILDSDSKKSSTSKGAMALPRTRSAIEIDLSSIGDVLTKARPHLEQRDFASLVVSDDMAVVGAILQSSSRDEKMSMLFPLLRLFASRKKLSRLIRWAIEIEVASVMNVATLFRSDDYASRLVSTYSKSVGSGYIQAVLKDPLQRICALTSADVELSGKIASGDAGVAQSRANRLMEACQDIIDSILWNVDKIPPSYFHICSHLNSKVIRRFDGSSAGVAVEDPVTVTRSVIGGFLFLRFVCPAITTPHLYGLIDKEPDSDTRRVLVLITKLLFKTATCVMFGDREPKFRVLNTFIEKNSPAIHQLYVKLSEPPESNVDECFAADSKNVFSSVPQKLIDADVEEIRVIAQKNSGAVELKLIECEAPQILIESFKESVFSVEKEVEHFLVQKIQKTKKLNMSFLSFGKKPRKTSDV